MKTRTLNIPTIGAALTLAKDWTFTAWAEYRNSALMNYLLEQGIVPVHKRPNYRYVRNENGMGSRAEPDGTFSDTYEQFDPETREMRRYACTLPRGTQLRVNRIYIRQGAGAYDSLTFWADLAGSKKKIRFWAKLADVNTMVVVDGAVDLKARKEKPKPVRAILLRDST